ncbi:hypothetical protein GGI12_000908 [Dipsacomyces acuminosporus]|nr:hypothetical protein GGI12_000908 [Dipsacomyces acuminosporus]
MPPSDQESTRDTKSEYGTVLANAEEEPEPVLSRDDEERKDEDNKSIKSKNTSLDDGCSSDGRDRDEDGNESGEYDDVLFVPEDEYMPLDDDDDDDDDDGGDVPDDDNQDTSSQANLGPDFALNIDSLLDQKMDELAEAFEIRQQQASALVHSTQPVDSSEPPPPPPPPAVDIVPMEVSIDSKSRMPKEHIDQIKSIMAGIQISDHAIPEWAKRVPESAWAPKRKE